MDNKNTSVYGHKSVSLSEDERQIVNGLAARFSLTFSGALRIIIREWSSDHDEAALSRSKNIFQRMFSVE